MYYYMPLRNRHAERAADTVYVVSDISHELLIDPFMT